MMCPRGLVCLHVSELVPHCIIVHIFSFFQQIILFQSYEGKMKKERKSEMTDITVLIDCLF